METTLMRWVTWGSLSWLSSDKVLQGPIISPWLQTDFEISELPGGPVCLQSSHTVRLTSSFHRDLDRNLALNRHLQQVKSSLRASPQEFTEQTRVEKERDSSFEFLEGQEKKSKFQLFLSYGSVLPPQVISKISLYLRKRFQKISPPLWSSKSRPK